MNDHRTQILLCDDETHLREMVGEYLEESGYDVISTSGAAELHEQLEKNEPELIILDVKMPRVDGLTALKELRAKSNVPVIMLTAATDVVDRIVGLELGADDYICKPVDLRELGARIKAHIRRKKFNNDDKEEEQLLKGTIAFGSCRLDIDAAKLYRADGVEIALTAMEFSLLKVFAENRGRILNRDQLLEKAHDKGWEPFDRSIDLRISRIRRKIEINPNKPETIRTVRGLGYIFG
ncbi:response regulator transcription factor [Lentilitoribacter sp. Alg239-R112]|uniref:response regulator n=1 Tax=Lentilitoribacter sp. Alg239-R112 TaxID=2305987 RepID=UPI0013A68E0E|nr:response regulator transcription factor [Lentilitoribacter sp. Alg239-R112]